MQRTAAAIGGTDRNGLGWRRRRRSSGAAHPHPL